MMRRTASTKSITHSNAPSYHCARNVFGRYWRRSNWRGGFMNSRSGASAWIVLQQNIRAGDVCFTPDSGHVQCTNPMSALCHKRTLPDTRNPLSGFFDVPIERYQIYSNTSLASKCRVTGTFNPRVLAVRILMTKSNLVLRIIGKSPGFSPLRIRPTYKPACRLRSAIFDP